MRNLTRLNATIQVAVLCLACSTPGFALAANLVTNGSFESGTAGWTVGSGTCNWVSVTATQVTNLAGEWVAPTPTNGTKVLLSDAQEIGTCTFQQDIALPGGTTNTLTLAAGYNYRDYDGNPAACRASVTVTTTGGTLIATAYSATGGTNQALAARSPVDLTAQAGSTVRVLVSVTSCDGGPAGVILDNVVIDSVGAMPAPIPTLSQWGLLLLGLLTATAGAVFSRRKQEQA